ncbi:MAG: acyl-CoA transferase [Pseudomonadota bacterium]
MASARETILLNLYAALILQFRGTLVDLRRNEVLPTKIAPAGLVIFRDGDPGEPEHSFSPLRYHYEHRAQIEVFVQAGSGREALFDSLCQSIGAAVVADRTLAGLCDWVEAEAPEPDDTPVEGAPAYRAAIIGVRLHYAVSDPLI